MRYLWVIRHAKSAEGSISGSDHDRPLANRGQSDGPRMRDFYAAHDRKAEWIWVSSAVRAQETAQFVADGMGTEIITAPELYMAHPEAILDVVRATPPGIEAVAVVAHNPGLTQITNLLGPDAVTDNLVTFGSALFAVETEWENLTFATNHFLSLTTPKTLD